MADYNFIFRYGFTQTWTEVASQKIGASTSISFSDIESHSDDNSVYVAWTGEDSTNNEGRQEDPYRTIQYALVNMTSNQSIITIMDDNYYYTGDAVDLYFDVDGITLQGMEGKKPVLTIDTSIASQLNMLRLQNAGKIINIDIQIPTGYSEQVTGIDARYGTIQNVTIDGANKNGIQKSTSSEVTIENSIIKNSINDGDTDGNGILFQEGTLNLDYSLVHSNDYAGVHATGTGTKVLTYDHSIIADNAYGSHEYSATNLTMTVTDSILYKNKIYDHYGSAATISYSCIGKINGSPTLTTATNILRINPLFVSNSDYRIRTKYNGYGDDILTSPCVGVSSTLDDMGCYQYTRTLGGQSYNEFEISVPTFYTEGKRTVDGKVVTVRSIYPKLVYRGILNTLDIGWSGTESVLTEDEFNSIEEMFEDDNDIIYLSIDKGVTYSKYLLDKTKSLSGSRSLMKETNLLRQNVRLSLIEV